MKDLKPILGAILVGGLCAAGYFLDARRLTLTFLDWMEANVEQNPMTAPVAYILLLAVFVPLCLPITALEVLAGYFFGCLKGAILQLAGKFLGNTIAIIIGRYFLREFVKKKVLYPGSKMSLIEKAIDKGGFKIVVLIRAVFLPMLIKNYGLAVTNVPLHHIIFAGLISGIPFAFTRTYVGSVAVSAKQILAGDTASVKDMLFSNFAVGIPVLAVVTALLLWFSTYTNSIFKTILAEQEESKKKDSSASSDKEDDEKEKTDGSANIRKRHHAETNEK